MAAVSPTEPVTARVPAQAAAVVTRWPPGLIDLGGGPERRADAPAMAPRPPTLGRAPATPWRASGLPQRPSSKRLPPPEQTLGPQEQQENDDDEADRVLVSGRDVGRAEALRDAEHE